MKVHCYRPNKNIEIPSTIYCSQYVIEISVYLYIKYFIIYLYKYQFIYTIKLLLTEILVHTGNICSDVHGAWTSCLERLNKYFLVWTSRSVNKSILRMKVLRRNRGEKPGIDWSDTILW